MPGQGSTVHLLLQIEPCAGPDASIEAVIKDGHYPPVKLCGSLRWIELWVLYTARGSHNLKGQTGALST